MDCINTGKTSEKNAFLDVRVVILVCDWRAHQVALLLYHNSDELLSDVVSCLEGSEVEITFPAPVSVHVLCFESIEYIEQSQVVTIRMCEFALLSIGLLLLVSRSNEDIWNV